MPWEINEEYNKYQRTIKYYEIEYDKDTEIEGYLSEHNVLNSYSEVETSDDIPEGFYEYSESKYEITMKEIEEKYKVGDLTDFADTMCVIWFIALLIYFLIAVGIKKSLLVSDISECKRDARLAKESKTYVDELIPKVNQLVKECKELSELLKNDPRRILTEELLENQEEAKQYTK